MERISKSEAIHAVMLSGASRNGDGDPVCSCGELLTVQQPWCRPCTERREAQYRREEAERHTEDAWAVTSETLPRWPWARLDNSAWAANVDKRVLAAVRVWSPGRGLLLLGPTGCGKTSALVARLHSEHASARYQARHRGQSKLVPVMWTTEADLVAAQRAHPLGRGPCSLVRDAGMAKALIIDEVGPAGDRQLMMAIADARYGRGLRTVITSGLTLPQLVSTYGDAFVRRVLTGGTPVDLHGATP